MYTLRSLISGKKTRRGENHVRSFKTSERVKRPVLKVIVVVMIVRPAEREGLEMSWVPQFGIVDNLWSPLVTRSEC